MGEITTQKVINMVKTKKGILLTILSFALLYTGIFICQPIWQALLVAIIPAIYLNLFMQVFGYVLFGFSIALLIISLLLNAKKHGFAKNTCFVAFIMLFIVSLPYALPIWYNSIWVF